MRIPRQRWRRRGSESPPERGNGPIVGISLRLRGESRHGGGRRGRPTVAVHSEQRRGARKHVQQHDTTRIVGVDQRTLHGLTNRSAILLAHPRPNDRTNEIVCRERS